MFAAGPATFVPAADAYVSSAQPAANFGTAQQLSLANGSDVRRGYLRFTVAGLTSPVSRATLRLWSETASSDGFTVHKVADTTWGETTVNYQNAPSINNNQTDKSNGYAAGQYVELAVTPLVTGNGTVSFGLKKAGNKAGTAAFDSREGAHPPQLVVEQGDSTPPAVTLTTPPSGTVTSDPTPTLAGDAGTATGDQATVTVRIYAGGSASGTPVQTAGTNQSGGRWTLDAAALADGTYTAQAQQSDVSGNVGTSAPSTFTVDTAAPGVSLSSPAPGAFVPTATPALSGAAGIAAGDGAQVTVKLYAGTGAGGTPVQTLSVTRQGASWSATAGALADGVYTAQAEQSDTAGNRGLSAAVTFSVDTDSPGVTVDSPFVGESVGTADPLLSGSAGTDPGDVASITVEIYAGPIVTGLPARVIAGVVPSASIWATHAGPLADGTWTVRAVQDDTAGNHGVSDPVTFAIDTVAPSVSISSPSAGERVGSATPLLAGAAGAADDDDETVAVDIFPGGSASGTPAQSLTAPRSGSGWSVAAGTLTDGTYTARARQSDAAGNTGTSTAVTFTIDTTAPPVAVLSPPDGFLTTRPAPQLTGTAGDAAGDAALVTVELFTGAVATGLPVQSLSALRSGTSWSATPEPLAAGTYTVRAAQLDAAGNRGVSAPHTFTVDGSAPTVTLAEPTAGAVTGDATPRLSGTAGNRDGDATAVTVRLWSGTNTAAAPLQVLSATRSGAAWSVNAATLADGTYTARAEQSSGSGALGLSATVTFSVDTRVATVTIDQPLPDAQVSDATPTLSGTAGSGPSDGATVTVRLWAGTSASGTALQTLSAPRSGTSWTVDAATLAGGTYTAQASQATGGGATATSAAVTFVIDTTAPAVAITSPASGSTTADPQPVLAGTAGSAAGDAAVVTVELFAGGTASGTPVQTLTAAVASDAWQTQAAALQDGVYTARARQVDAAGNVGTSQPATFTVDTVAPVVTLTQPAANALLNDPTPDLGGAASNGSGDAATVTVLIYAGAAAGGTPAATVGATRTGGTWSATAPTLADGTYTAVAEQSDAAGHVGRSGPVTFSIDATAPAPALTSPSDGAALRDPTPPLAGVAGTAAGDDASVTVTVWAGGSPSGTPLQTLSAAVGGGGAFSATPASLGDGVYTARARQGDAAGNVGLSTAVTFTVDTVAPTMSIDTPAPGATVSTPTPQLAGPAGSATGDATTVAVALYAGTTVSGTPLQTFTATRSGGRWSVQASTLGDGAYTIRATQQDAAGNTTTATSTFSVAAAVPGVTLDQPPADAVLRTSTPQLSGTAGTAVGDASQVTVKVYAGTAATGTPVQTLTATRSGSAWSVVAASLADGTYTARAQQAGAAGTGFSAPRTFSVDTAAPVVTLTSPSNGSLDNVPATAFAGQAGVDRGDDAQVTVDVYPGTSASGTPVQSLTAAVGSGAWTVTGPALADGTYTARARQSDAAGNTGTSGPATFTVDTAAPTVTLTTPADGARSADTSFDFAGAAGENGTVTVELYEGTAATGIPVETLTATAAGGAWSVSSAVRNDGVYTARAQMRDAAGNVGFSAPHTFTLDTIAPIVKLTAPASLSILPSGPAFSGTAGTLAGDAGTVSVKVFSGSTTSGPLVQTLTATVAANGSWSVAGSLAQGSYTARAEQLDAAGNLGRSTSSTFKIGPSYQSEVTADAPQNWWRLGEAAGTTAASSVASGGTAGSYLNGVTLRAPGAVAGDPDTAARFDGVNDSVSMGDPTNGSLDLGTGDITIEAWMRTTVNNATTVVAKQGSTTGAYWNLLVYSAAPNLGKLRFTATDGTTTRQIYSAVRVDDGLWHHVAVVLTRSTGLDMYVDNQRTTAAGALTTNVDNTAAFQIGKAFNYNYFSGDVDEVAIYRRALSAARIAAHFQAGFGPDVTAPAVSLTSPAAAAVTDDTKPTLSGRIGTAPGDLSPVTVRVYSGPAATGTPVQTLAVTPAATGAWSTNATPALADGTYTATASQDDASGNTGTTAPRTFQVQHATGPPQYRDAVLGDLPAAFWRLGERAGTAAGDETSGDSAGSLESGLLLGDAGAVLGDADTAVRFDGIDDAIDAGDPVSGALDLGTSNATVEAWIRTTSAGVGSIVGKLPASGPSWQVLITNFPGRQGAVRAKFSDGTTTLQAYSSVTVNDGQWHHVTVVLDRGAGLTVDVDGISSSVAGTLSGTLSNDGALGIGKLPGYPTFDGQIDEVAIYRSALSPARIAAHALEATRADTTAPAPTLTAPAGGATVADATPAFAGQAGAGRGDVPRVTVKVYAGTAATGTPVQTAPLVVDPAHQWTLEPGTAFTAGTYTAQAEQADTAGNVGRSAAVTFTVAPPSTGTSDPVLLAAGDIAGCDTFGDEATAALLDALPGTVQTLGDHAYEDGSPTQFTDCYDPTWGRFKTRTRPSVGDHEYHTANAAGYFGYFGAAAGDPAKGYYSYDLGAWHVVVTNGVCDHVSGGCGPGSPQIEWLIGDLADHPAACTLAVIATPRFSSGAVHGPDGGTQTFWNTLAAAGADVVLSADDHIYERFAPQTAYGRSSPANGIREFIVGTGGRSHYDLAGPQPNSEARDNTSFGVLRLELHPTGYDWRFVPVSGATFTDAGSTSCH